MDYPYTLVLTADETSDVISTLANVPEFALDLETTGLDHRRDEIHGISFATHNKSWYVAHDGVPAVLDVLPQLVINKSIAMHNASFDAHFLRERSVYIPTVFDTMIAQFMVDENQSLGLKALAPVKLGVLDTDIMEFKDLMRMGKRLTGKTKLGDVNVYDIPLETLAYYGAKDARLTYDLAQVSKFELRQEGMMDYFMDIEMPFLNVLLNMEDAGMYINQDAVKELIVEYTTIRDRAYTTFIELTNGVNPNSPEQVRTYLFDVCKFKPTRYTVTMDGESKRPSTDALALIQLLDKDKRGVIAVLLEYRKYDKLLSTYLLPFSQHTDGWVHGQFNQIGAETGRLSSENPNLQNIPAHGDAGAKLRYVFAAPPGEVFIDVDYSQLELRIAAHYTRDPNLLKVFRDNLDPHQMTADLMGVERYVGKTLNFAWFYGAGPIKLADTVQKNGNPRPQIADTKMWIERFEQSYPTAVAWRNAAVEYATRLGYVKTIGGRKRRLPDLQSRIDGLRFAAQRQAINAIIQGSAADIIKMAMLEIAGYQGEYGAKMRAQVHDELAFSAKPEVVEEFEQRVSTSMVSVGEKLGMRVPLIAEPGHGASWGDAK